MRKTLVTIRETVKHNTQPFSQHNVRFYGRHVEFWNHLRNSLTPPYSPNIFRKSYQSILKNSKGLLNSVQKNWPGGNFTPPPITVRGLG